MAHIVKEIDNCDLQLFNPHKLHPFIQDNLEDILIFDIETTGLHHQYAEVILIGYLYVKNGQVFIEQLFAKTPKEEKAILETFAEIVKGYDYLLSYNGNTFDIPFLKSRFHHHQLSCILDKSMNIDLLKIARQLSKGLNLENNKLKTVEKFLGIFREDTISGKDSVDLYWQYVSTPSTRLKEKILLHNFEDILYLGKVIDLLYYQGEENLSNIPKRFYHDMCRYYLINYKITKDFLTLEFFSRDLSSNRIHFLPGQLSFEQNAHQINMKLPIFELKLEGQSLQFIDIDLLSEGEINFNALSYDEKLQFLIHPNTIHQCVCQVYKRLRL